MATEVIPQRMDSDYTTCQHGSPGQDATTDTYTVDIELAVGADIEQPAGGVVGAGDERVAIREELDGVDIGFVASKGLDCLTGPNIPEFCESIAGTGDEGVLVGRVQADAHDVSKMIRIFHNLASGLNVPLHARHIA